MTAYEKLWIDWGRIPQALWSPSTPAQRDHVAQFPSTVELSQIHKAEPRPELSNTTDLGITGICSEWSVHDFLAVKVTVEWLVGV